MTGRLFFDNAEEKRSAKLWFNVLVEHYEKTMLVTEHSQKHFKNIEMCIEEVGIGTPQA